MAWGKRSKLTGRIRPNTESLRSGKKAVHSYYNKIPNATQQPAAYIEKIINLADRPHHMRRLPTILAIIAILLSFLFSLTLSRSPSITTADKSQQSPYRNVQEYVDASKQILGQKLSYRSKLTVNTLEVEQALLERFPELDAAVLRLPVLGRRPNLVIAISQPAMLLAAHSKSYIIDSNGIAVSEASGIPIEVRQRLTVIKDESGLEISLGKQVVTSDTIAFISNVTAQLKAQNLEVSQLTLPRSANQLDIRLKGLNYYIKTDATGDARQQVGSFLAVKDHLSKQGITLAEYVDVRVEEKVFYK